MLDGVLVRIGMLIQQGVLKLDTAEYNEPALALCRSAGFSDEAYEGGRALLLRLQLG